MSRYFSNGTAGYAWQAEWCDRCVHDHDEMHITETGPGCLIYARSFVDEIIPEWIDNRATEGWNWLPPAITCIEFSRCSCDNGPDDPGEEPPPPVDPNQGVMFDADALAPGVPRGVYLDALQPAGKS